MKYQLGDKSRMFLGLPSAYWVFQLVVLAGVVGTIWGIHRSMDVGWRDAFQQYWRFCLLAILVVVGLAAFVVAFCGLLYRYRKDGIKTAKSEFGLLLGGISVLAFALPYSSVASGVNDSIVKIYTVQDRPAYYTPWQKEGPTQSTGSGCIIKGRKILTNAHVVSDSTFIQVRLNGKADRFNARVEAVSHEADLALLTVDDPAFFKDASYLEQGTLPEVQQEITVYGFPAGGDTMCVTKGVVSRVEHQEYVHSGQSLLAVQIDAAINPGSSGGPAIVGGKIAGVAMMSVPGANNIGYIIPATVVGYFLKDLEDGRHDGFPKLGVILQGTANPGMRRSLGMPEGQAGALVSKVERGSPATGFLVAGDVITRLDGRPVANDTTVELRKGERTSLREVGQEHQMGETIKVDFLREGKSRTCEFALTLPLKADPLVPLQRYDVMPTYYICGGLVFCPLTTDLLMAWGQNWLRDAPSHLTSYLLSNNKDDNIDEVVVLMRVLPSDLNQGYQESVNIVVPKVNGREIRGLRDLIGIVESGAGQFVAFEDPQGRKIVLELDRVRKEQEDILRTYGIQHDRSEDLRKPVLHASAKGK